MTTEKIIDAIGMIDEKYIADAHNPIVKIKHGGLKKFTLAAAAVLCVSVPLPVMTAFGSDIAYNLLYMVMPSVAQTFKPVQESCEDKNIRMEVISAGIDGDEANFYISMHGDKIDATTDLYDSYSIKCPFDSVGHISFSEFDENTNTAYFMVNIKTMNGEKIPNGKVTFSVNELIFDKHMFEGPIDNINLSDVMKNPLTTENINYRGHGGNPEYAYVDDYKELCSQYLVPYAEPLTVPLKGVSVTGMGYIDGKLHIQTYYEDILKNDNHGFVSLIDENGEKVRSFASISFWDDKRKGSYDEDLFSVDFNELENYSLWGEFWTSNGYETGDWEVTFKME